MTDNSKKRIQILEFRIHEAEKEIKYRNHEITRIKNEIRLLESERVKEIPS
jgi:hypothetical protein